MRRTSSRAGSPERSTSPPRWRRRRRAVAVAILAGGKPIRTRLTNGTTNNGKRNVPSFLATPTWITKKNINLLYKDGQLKKSEVCTGSYKIYC